MSAAEVNEIKKYVADYITGYVGPIGSDVKDVRYQLTGSRDLVAPGSKINEDASYPGLDMLGGLTPVEALAALGYRAGIPGFIDPITGARR